MPEPCFCLIIYCVTGGTKECLIPMLHQIHTLFSEESGEIALSVLADSQPPNYRTDFDLMEHSEDRHSFVPPVPQ